MLLRSAAVGVCGSDLHQWTAEHSWPVNYPVVLGHEFAGDRAQAGQARSRASSEGDRGVSETAAVIDSETPADRAGARTTSTPRARVSATASTAR